MRSLTILSYVTLRDYAVAVEWYAANAFNHLRHEVVPYSPSIYNNGNPSTEDVAHNPLCSLHSHANHTSLSDSQVAYTLHTQ